MFYSWIETYYWLKQKNYLYIEKFSVFSNNFFMRATRVPQLTISHFLVCQQAHMTHFRTISFAENCNFLFASETQFSTYNISVIHIEDTVSEIKLKVEFLQQNNIIIYLKDKKKFCCSG
jgi:hypothetical protein